MQTKKSNVFSIRLPDDLRLKLEERAKKENRSLSNLIIFILRKGLENG